MRLIYIAVMCLLLGVACNNSGNDNHENTGQAEISAIGPPASPEPARSRLDDAGTQMLVSVVKRYYTLKNALVATKSADADSAAARLSVAADSLLAYLQKDTANASALKPFVDTLINQSKMVTCINDANCEKQRLSFGIVSSAMYGLLKAVQLKHVPIYHEYCPMAFNEKGATWLSEETDIKNPYFGKKMLECGEVTDSLK